MNLSVKNFPGAGLSGAATAAIERLPQSKTFLGGREQAASELMHSGPMNSLSNLGGILGRCTSQNPDIGPPFQTEVLGAVLAFPDLGDRVGRPASIRDGAVPAADRLECNVPVIYVAGTCMNAGKTVAATELVQSASP